MHEIIHVRAYTLALADIPYGFGLAGCLNEDTIAWGVEEIRKMVQSFKIFTKAKL